MSSHNTCASPDLPFARLAVLIGLAVSGQAMAAGFAVQNQNGAGTATAFAGAAAVADDASTIYFNPAGMTYLPMGHSISVAGTLLHRSLKFDDRGSNALGPFPLGDDGGEGGGLSLIPAGYYSYAINDRFRIGVGVSATFGNKTDYSTTFLGRFQGNYVDLKALNINPSVAWRVNDQLSIGAGISFVKLEGDIQQQLPVSPLLPNARNRLEADDTAMGFQRRPDVSGDTGDARRPVVSLEDRLPAQGRGDCDGSRSGDRCDAGFREDRIARYLLGCRASSDHRPLGSHG